MNSDDLILRQTANPPLVNKNDFLDNADFDGNLINIYNDLVALCVTSGVIDYDAGTTYDDALVQYAMYDQRLYKWIGVASGSNVTPGTEAAVDYWLEIFPTDLAHRKNSDTLLAEGTADEVSAADIRAFIDAGLTTTTNLSITTQTSTSLKIESSTGTDVTLNGATESEAGLLNATDKAKLNQLSGRNTGDQTLEDLGAEATANKVGDFSTINGILFPTTQAVETRIVEKIAAVVDAAPAALDTLNELAAALGDDANFASTMTTALAGKEATANKDASNGYAGLTLLKINFKNVLNTFTSFFTNSNTAARTYTFQDRNGTIADDTDLAGKEASLPSMVGNALKILRVNAGATDKEWATLSVPSGVCGISDASGVYTYYATLTLAIAAATSGQVVEVFADIAETGAVQINLKNGVNINFNGHTYTLNNAGTSNCFSDNNVAVSCKLMNGVVTRTGGTNTGSNSFCLDIINTASIIDATGMKFTSSFSVCCRLFAGILNGGYYYGYTIGISVGGICSNVHSFGQTSYGLSMNGGHLSNSFAFSTGSYGMIINGGMVSSCYGHSTVNAATLIQGGIISNSTFHSSGGIGIWAYSGSPVINNCTGSSSSSVGIDAGTTCVINNCTGYSTANIGLRLASGSIANNCTGYSATNNGVRIDATSRLNIGVAYSLAAAACYTNSILRGVMCISKWNNASGHAITGDTTAFTEVFNCQLEVTHASANCLHYASAITVYYGINSFKGATTSVNANITQGQAANIMDAYGNIKIG